MSSVKLNDDPPQQYALRARQGASKSLRTFVHHVKRHVGVGIICSVAYFDPYVVQKFPCLFSDILGRRGNWSVDLEAGSKFGYRPMLFVILMAGLGAIVLQVSEEGHR